jgi:hypothetical protein
VIHHAFEGVGGVDRRSDMIAHSTTLTLRQSIALSSETAPTLLLSAATLTSPFQAMPTIRNLIVLTKTGVRVIMIIIHIIYKQPPHHPVHLPLEETKSYTNYDLLLFDYYDTVLAPAINYPYLVAAR